MKTPRTTASQNLDASSSWFLDPFHMWLRPALNTQFAPGLSLLTRGMLCLTVLIFSIFKASETTRASETSREVLSSVAGQLATAEAHEITPRIIEKSKIANALSLYNRQVPAHCGTDSSGLSRFIRRNDGSMGKVTRPTVHDFLKGPLESSLPSFQKFPWNSKGCIVLLKSESLLEIGLPAPTAHPNQYGDLSDRSSRSAHLAIQREADRSSAPMAPTGSAPNQINDFFCNSIQEIPPECTVLNAMQRLSTINLEWRYVSSFQVGPELATHRLRQKSTVLVDSVQGSAA